VAEFYI